MIRKIFAPLCMAAIASSFCVSTATAGVSSNTSSGAKQEQNFGLRLPFWGTNQAQNFGWMQPNFWGVNKDQNLGFRTPFWGADQQQNFSIFTPFWGANKAQDFGIVNPFWGVNQEQNFGFLFNPFWGTNQGQNFHWVRPAFWGTGTEQNLGIWAPPLWGAGGQAPAGYQAQPQFVQPQYAVPAYIMLPYQPAFAPQQGAVQAPAQTSGPVQCSINQVAALTKSVDDCERAGGEIPEATKTAAVKDATNRHPHAWYSF